MKGQSCNHTLPGWENTGKAPAGFQPMAALLVTAALRSHCKCCLSLEGFWTRPGPGATGKWLCSSRLWEPISKRPVHGFLGPCIQGKSYHTLPGLLHLLADQQEALVSPRRLPCASGRRRNLQMTCKKSWSPYSEKRNVSHPSASQAIRPSVVAKSQWW